MIIYKLGITAALVVSLGMTAAILLVSPVGAGPF